ncbi:hypothetical protein [Rhodococcus sp. (in: high G+C Gram-positive bacteria)]|uniref:hypothetical protein n=1 Tax=Rhodococcus sp. TaxID=1831 RepID=UPI001A1DAE5D|nr:hypothetical protein [Rhodococcus sp. (in: high G+C Gram-positive bacteria)]MBJ7478662.1 hypothetical protein [Rhodococcus sp. (in: high G+C Gram-positive bacteria)]
MSDRINFAYLRSTPRWDAHLLRSGQVLRLAGDDIPDPRLATQLDALNRPERSRTEQLIRSRDLPDYRRIPQGDSELRVSFDIALPFKTNSAVDLRLKSLRLFRTGLAFHVVAHETTVEQMPPLNQPSNEQMNFGSRIKPGEPHRIRLIVDTITGPILANSTHPGDYPDDPNEPWLHGGRSGRGIAENLYGITTGGEYFLSPPPLGPLWITVAYPEFDLTSTTIELQLPQLS